ILSSTAWATTINKFILKMGAGCQFYNPHSNITKFSSHNPLTNNALQITCENIGLFGQQKY
ncbi:hypothetical protein, partial [Agaribacter flavus]